LGLRAFRSNVGRFLIPRIIIIKTIRPPILCLILGRYRTIRLAEGMASGLLYGIEVASFMSIAES